MLKRILGLLGWLGVALVFAAVAIRFTQAGMAAVVQRPGDRRAGLHAALHPQPVARGRALVLRAAGAARHRSPPRSVIVVLGDPGRDQLLGVAAQQALGPDGGASSSRCPTRRRRCCRVCRSRCTIRVFDAQRRTSTRFRDRLDEYQYASKQVSVEYIDVERRPTLANAVQGSAARHGRDRVRRTHRARHLATANRS